MKTTVWRLKKGSDRRFRTGHPWVYSNELAVSPKGLEPGAPVELQDPGGAFLARGYGNPASLIAFRVVSRDPEVVDPLAPEALGPMLETAAEFRRAQGLSAASHRLFFAEADGFPGLIIDRYRIAGGGTVFSIQAHTAGADRILASLPPLLESLVDPVDKGRFGLIIRNDVGIRKLEGISEEPARVVRELKGVDLSQARILAQPALGNEPIEFVTDLLEGQKTGFFLDQWANVQLAARRLSGLRPKDGKRLRILDLCCYVGQWSAQLSAAFRAQGVAVDVLAVDASAKALELAKRNIEKQGAVCETVKADVLKDLATLPDSSFDIVIADPPALIKGRKDVASGAHAYLQLNTQVFRLVRPGGGVVCCSCSALFEEERFLETLAKAANRSRARARWIARGGQAPDHPVLAEFPEGRYLKAWIGISARGNA
jgi:23S rRNA (cytosine1962-C5)-methyltransferase